MSFERFNIKPEITEAKAKPKSFERAIFEVFSKVTDSQVQALVDHFRDARRNDAIDSNLYCLASINDPEMEKDYANV